jgi:hypothetical protein
VAFPRDRRPRVPPRSCSRQPLGRGVGGLTAKEHSIINILALVPRGLPRDQIATVAVRRCARASRPRRTLDGFLRDRTTVGGLRRRRSQGLAEARLAKGAWGDFEERLLTTVSGGLQPTERALLHALRAGSVGDLEEGLWAAEMLVKDGKHRKPLSSRATVSHALSRWGIESFANGVIDCCRRTSQARKR